MWQKWLLPIFIITMVLVSHSQASNIDYKPLAIGNKFFYIINQEGILYFCDADECQEPKRLVKIFSNEKLKFVQVVAQSKDMVLVLSVENVLYHNIHRKGSATNFVKSSSFKNIAIRSISAAQHLVAVLTNDGHVYYRQRSHIKKWKKLHANNVSAISTANNKMTIVINNIVYTDNQLAEIPFEFLSYKSSTNDMVLVNWHSPNSNNILKFLTIIQTKTKALHLFSHDYAEFPETLADGTKFFKERLRDSEDSRVIATLHGYYSSNMKEFKALTGKENEQADLKIEDFDLGQIDLVGSSGDIYFIVNIDTWIVLIRNNGEIMVRNQKGSEFQALSPLLNTLIRQKALATHLKWSEKDHGMFNKDFCQAVFTLMLCKPRLQGMMKIKIPKPIIYMIIQELANYSHR